MGIGNREKKCTRGPGPKCGISDAGPPWADADPDPEGAPVPWSPPFGWGHG
jgi:hypothetical protein